MSKNYIASKKANNADEYHNDQEEELYDIIEAKISSKRRRVRTKKNITGVTDWKNIKLSEKSKNYAVGFGTNGNKKRDLEYREKTGNSSIRDTKCFIFHNAHFSTQASINEIELTTSVTGSPRRDGICIQNGLEAATDNIKISSLSSVLGDVSLNSRRSGVGEGIERNGCNKELVEDLQADPGIILDSKTDEKKRCILTKLLAKNKYNTMARIKLSRLLPPLKAKELLLGMVNELQIWMEILSRFYSEDLLEEALQFSTRDPAFYKKLFYVERALFFSRGTHFLENASEYFGKLFYKFSKFYCEEERKFCEKTLKKSNTGKRSDSLFQCNVKMGSHAFLNAKHGADVLSSLSLQSSLKELDFLVLRLLRILNRGIENTQSVDLYKLKLLVVKDKSQVVYDAASLLLNDKNQAMESLLDLYAMVEQDANEVEKVFGYLRSKGTWNSMVFSRCLGQYSGLLLERDFKFIMRVLEISDVVCKIPILSINREEIAEYLRRVSGICSYSNTDLITPKFNLYVNDKEMTRRAKSGDSRGKALHNRDEQQKNPNKSVNAATDVVMSESNEPVYYTILYVEHLAKLKIKPMYLEYMTPLPNCLVSFFISIPHLLDDDLFIESYNILRNFTLTYDFIVQFFIRSSPAAFDYLFKAKELYKLFLQNKNLAYLEKTENVLLNALGKFNSKQFVLARSKIYFNSKNFVRAYTTIPEKMRTIKKHVIYACVNRAQSIKNLKNDLFSYKHYLLYAELLHEEGLDPIPVYQDCMVRHKNQSVVLAYLRYLKMYRWDIAYEESERLVELCQKQGDVWFEKYVIHKKLKRVSLSVLYTGRHRDSNERIEQEIKYLENKDPINNKLEIFYVYRRLIRKGCNREHDKLCKECADYMTENIKRIIKVHENGDLFILWYLVDAKCIEEIRRFYNFYDHRNGFYWPRLSRIADLKERLEKGAALMKYDIT